MNGGHSISNNAPDFLQNATKQIFFWITVKSSSPIQVKNWKLQVE